MKFTRQWNAKEPFEPKERSLKSLTIPNQVKSLREMLQRMEQGNMFGIPRLAVEYGGEGDEIPCTDIDQSDPLTSYAEARSLMSEIHSDFKQRMQKKEPLTPPTPTE